jgi:hypothetical protein
MAMGHRETLKSASEVDAIQEASHIKHRSGVRAYAKTTINRRSRLEAREQLRVMLGWSYDQIQQQQELES